MKKVNLIIAIMIGAIFIASCKKDEKPNLNKITGTYTGTIDNNSNKVSIPATVEVSATDDYTVSIHCYNDSLDTTFVMGIYQEDNTIYCNNNNGSDNNHMMGMNHCNSTEHHGEFDFDHNAFHYSFEKENQNFNGTRK